MKYPFEIGKNLKEPTKIETIKKVFKDVSVKNFDYFITKLLKKGGWKFVEDTIVGSIWKKDFASIYTTSVRAIIGYKDALPLEGTWQYGIQWLEGDYSNQNQPLPPSSLKDIIGALRLGLLDLLAIGIPYHPASNVAHDKDFYGLSYYDIKRNIDLINATKLLEINYKAILKHIFEGDKEKLEKAVYKASSPFNIDWLREELENEEEE